MLLKVILDDQVHSLNIPEEMVQGAEELFSKMDADMDQGWQMSRDWVESLDSDQRCRVVADKLLTALENNNQPIGTMMAAYILNRKPGIEGVDVDTTGDMTETRLLMPGDSY